MQGGIKTESLITILSGVFIIIVGVVIISAVYVRFNSSYKESDTFLKQDSRFTPRVGTLPLEDFKESFSENETINEVGILAKSNNKSWWVNSGGQLLIQDGMGSTMQGESPMDSQCRKKYATHNARDTDNGTHPQNIFRLVQTNQWRNFVQQAYFYVNTVSTSTSVNRNETNGLLLFNRYQTGDNLYYTGLRVDGAAVIKKKVGGIYYTLSYKKVIKGKYDRIKKPILLPMQTWIGLRSAVETTGSSTRILLFTDIGRTGKWTLAVEAVDDGLHYGNPITEKGYAGIRTDFMDVRFDDYEIQSFGSTTAMTVHPDLP